ncbi:MAG: cobalt-precorrin-5B (C(1))-methyltransferase CbiD [Bacillota bacterium]|nr:cobalt-precorrin-5B (C(1))-methyltransferase CbiD [Bacillota bacterium]
MNKVDNREHKHRTGIESYYIIKNNQRMQFGYTTGTCAAAATKAATRMLLTGENVDYVKLTTPKGISLNLEVVDTTIDENLVTCGIIKDAGDDPDATNGIKVLATVRPTDGDEITICGGVGVGRVTKPGLEQPIGEAAINSVPRKMILESIEEELKRAGKERKGIEVTISIPEGVEVAKKTFNPRLGIVGGISVLGTSGIVEPMSESALIRSLEVEVKQQITLGRRYLVVTLGNYGKGYLDNLEEVPLKDSVKCSNFVGEVIDAAVAYGAEGILFVAHIGKFIKVAGGIMNTHSRNSDSRVEIMASAALRAGISREGAMKILDSVTTDDGINYIIEEGVYDRFAEIICEKIGFYLNNRAYGRIETGAIVFSNVHGLIGKTDSADMLVNKIKDEYKK